MSESATLRGNIICFLFGENEGEFLDSCMGPTAYPTEEFECLDCYLLAPLNPHGRCQRCNSDAVFSVERLKSAGRWATVGTTMHYPTYKETVPTQQAVSIAKTQKGLKAAA